MSKSCHWSLDVTYSSLLWQSLSHISDQRLTWCQTPERADKPNITPAAVLDTDTKRFILCFMCLFLTELNRNILLGAMLPTRDSTNQEKQMAFLTYALISELTVNSEPKRNIQLNWAMFSIFNEMQHNTDHLEELKNSQWTRGSVDQGKRPIYRTTHSSSPCRPLMNNNFKRGLCR